MHAEADHAHSGEGIANPHERMASKHEITEANLAVDAYRKTLFCDFFAEEGQASQMLEYKPPSSVRNNLVFACNMFNAEFTKKISLMGDNLVVRYHFAKLPAGTFKVEINLAMPSCDGPAGRLRVGDDILGGFGQLLELDGIKHAALEDAVLGGAIHLFSSVPCRLVSQPHFSVSQSEAGFEKIMQALTLQLEWPSRACGEGFELKLQVSG